MSYDPGTFQDLRDAIRAGRDETGMPDSEFMALTAMVDVAEQLVHSLFAISTTLSELGEHAKQ